MLHVPKFNVKAIQEKFDALPQEEKERIYATNKVRTQSMLDSWATFRKNYPDLAESMVCTA